MGEREADRWRDAAIEALGVLLPVSCVVCGRDDRPVCHACLEDLAATPSCVRLVAGVRLDAPFTYRGTARALVLAFKVHGRLDVVGPLARPTVRALRGALAEAPDAVVVRVPSSRAGRRRRGFDPVVVLLRRGGFRTARVLRRVPDPRARGRRDGGQKSLSAVDRVTATVGTLRAVDVRDRAVVLVDDVVTTGVTMAEAIRAVRAAGGRVVRCVATASVEPSSPSEAGTGP
ncbi:MULTISPECIES: ComF family protein [unclassified Curtobacterium]|uniref:ComF family protein n=1 Tax=unclassified Curtobacterium TaxID=257496 RepID=UPI000DA98C59|nr:MULTISPECIES: phosphoribosyltransferase family protein [unclassified Curtobacterium]PZE26396.1 hypothetical protein DEI86_07830 [Curtobacterium sp. MCBD17_028]PZE75054.1 hypothetical protein DEI82_09255 [Curtobacterium sp. MCBD17_019]PZF58489.1 hypothetical protein DEI92_10445 [Curtobacterium sp. MCBD17_034]PZM34478.1 hypothetical protein DEI90_07015 [Curtobacterium sp. MCBD17_031]WIB62541.1 phosphoribosyltransferase family protein [Curtobacterium sp. MCBD17_040]